MSLPRLLRGLSRTPMNHDEHRRVHGALSVRTLGPSLVHEIRRADLRGRGGGGFPLALKLDAVRQARGTASIVVNGCESEPLSGKDHVLLTRLPHLVIDGALALARTVGATTVRVTVDERDLVADDVLRWALDERPELGHGHIGVEIVAMPTGYVAAQETAIVRWHQDGPAKPMAVPPRVTERGIDRRPTLVSNAETVAHVGLIARHGAEWYRQLGTDEQPGSALVTLGGAVARPGVYEVEYGTRLRRLLDAAGGMVEEIDAFLIGGYSGTWIDGIAGADVRLCDLALGRLGARLATGAIVAVPVSACPVAEIARVTRWMADQSAGQCGPCLHGLGSIADAMQAIVDGAATPSVLEDLQRWCRLTTGRGACSHPDGVARLVISTLQLFSDDLIDHAQHGRCDACARPSVLGVPEPARLR